MRHSFLLPIMTAIMLCSCRQPATEQKSADTGLIYDSDRDTSVYKNEMKRYWLVLLKSGPNRNQDSASAEKIQAGHMTNISRLVKAGKIVMAGPMGTDGDLRGIFIMDCKDSTEVERFVQSDTAVMTGRLKMEYYPWWTAKGKFIFK